MSAELKPLLPCPFCGGGAFLPEIENPDEDFQYAVRCAQCGCEIGGFQTEKDARMGWDSRYNTRPTVPQAAQGVEEAFKRGLLAGQGMTKLSNERLEDAWATASELMSETYEENFRLKKEIEFLKATPSSDEALKAGKMAAEALEGFLSASMFSSNGHGESFIGWQSSEGTADERMEAGRKALKACKDAGILGGTDGKA